MYIDKLDGKTGGNFLDRMAGQWRAEQRRLQHDIDRQPAREKRRLLNFVLSNCSREDGEVVATFRQPFDLLAETTALAARSSMGSGGNSSKNEIWLDAARQIRDVMKRTANKTIRPETIHEIIRLTDTRSPLM